MYNFGHVKYNVLASFFASQGHILPAGEEFSIPWSTKQFSETKKTDLVARPRKWSNTLKQFVGKDRLIV